MITASGYANAAAATSGATGGRYDLNFANISDATLPGESVEADPSGLLAAMEADSVTQSGQLPTAAAATTTTTTTTTSAANFLQSTFSLGSFQVPYWLAGLACLGAMWFFQKEGSR